MVLKKDIALLKRKKGIGYSRTYGLLLDDRKKGITVYNRGKGKKRVTVVADATTLKTMLTTRKYNTSNILQGFNTGIVRGKFFGRDKIEHRVRELNLKVIESVPLKNVFVRRYTKAREMKIGQVYTSITFISGEGKSVTVEGGSRRKRLLSDDNEVRTAFNEAYKGALGNAAINFSPKRHIVNWVHYSYYERFTGSERAARF